MGLLNYTTSVDVYKTLGKIQKKLVNYGVNKIMYDYDENGHVQALCFSIITPDGERRIKLPANVPSINDRRLKN